MKRFHSGFALLLVAAAAASLDGCHRPKTGSIDVTVIGNIPKLTDPAAGPTSVADDVLAANVAQGLVRFDARGQIDQGLAERWNVSDDGLSYIFRLQSEKWPSGRKIDAREVARLLNRARRSASLDALKDSVGAIDEIVAMTDRVIEIRLVAPRPNLLQLLAQPEFAIVRPVNGAGHEGSGPFQLVPMKPEEALHLRRVMPGADGEQEVREEVQLSGLPAPSAVARFKSGASDAVLGGGFSDLAAARIGGVPRGSLRFDPVVGIFALVPGRSGGPLADKALRSLLSRAIDREALVAAFDVEGLTPRATLLQPGLDGIGDVPAPAWLGVALAQRRAGLVTEANRLFGTAARPALSVSLPVGPGATVLFNRLASDWGAIGVRLLPAAAGKPVDFKLIDEVAPSTSPAWFVRRLRCERVALCDAQVDGLADAARATLSPQQRAQFLSVAAQRIDAEFLVFPLAAPIRWSLVSPDAPGFVENRFARHTLVGLGSKPARDRSE
ncbi:MAG: ABC transporter substrate-binding protein [Pseudomonadota bacterium]|nr:ABC transporter substrate-binding protein [Pseudomonadota bacterium]